MKKIIILNGPNLNMLGKREPEIYGPDTLDDIRTMTEQRLKNQVHLTWFQSNLEGELVSKLQEIFHGNYDGVVINPGAYAHTSVALYDAMKILKIPVVEVHLSQLYRREDFRQTLLTAKAATAIMSGFGKWSYFRAIQSLID